MALPVVVSPQARLDLVEAAEWYDEQDPDANIPIRLFEEFDSMVALIGERPDAFPPFEGPARRAILTTFPYGIYYVVEPQRVAVLYFIAMAQEQRSGH